MFKYICYDDDFSKMTFSGRELGVMFRNSQDRGSPTYGSGRGSLSISLACVIADIVLSCIAIV